MAISAIQETGASQSSGGSAVSKAYASNITNGNRIVVVGFKFYDDGGTTHNYAAGDCTKSAGTATIGVITLDKTADFNYSGNAHIAVGIWSAAVTGTGSATMQIGVGGSASTTSAIGIGEYSSTNGAITVAGISNSATGTSLAPNSGNVTSAGGTQALLIGGFASSSGNNPEATTPGGSWATIWEEENGFAICNGSSIREIVNNAVTDNANWSIAHSFPWNAIIAGYYEPLAGVPLFYYKA